MFDRTAALWLIVGVVDGYGMSGAVVKAQNASGAAAPVSVSSGDDLTLQFERGTFSENTSSMRCAVQSLEGTWVKCAASDGFGAERNQKWVNLAYVIQIIRREK